MKKKNNHKVKIQKAPVSPEAGAEVGKVKGSGQKEKGNAKKCIG
jgi:hypothetical protein